MFYFIRSDLVEVPKKPADFFYLGEFEPWSFEAFRPKQPNAKRGDQCLVSYLSLEPNASIYDFDCDGIGWQWASCTACFLPNTFLEYSNIVARGLCSRTLFDTIFEVKYDLLSPLLSLYVTRNIKVDAHGKCQSMQKSINLLCAGDER